jgi:alkanesulfonate monooxygenase SsuD/methylene tetrahydromethanopterin reductase-like flavin-dependent oxidoreductase (luciferase family)
VFIAYFTEQPYSALDDEQVRKHHPFDNAARQPGANILLHSNRFFDPQVGSRLYQQRIVEYKLAEEVGFDGIMLNEHHNSAFCMQPRCNIMSAVLAAVTKKIKIVQLGNPLPTWDNPVQLAEEIAMIDMISGGRLVAGIVRGGGQEQIANNISPAFNRARFQEAHDLLIETWTRPGPFRWEGDQYHVRVVNPWALPLQQPHPRIWVPGVSSKESILFAADHGYPYISLNTSMEHTRQIWALFDKRAAEHGFAGGPPFRGYLMRCHVAATEREALENAREFMWMSGDFAGPGHPIWSSPAGYATWEARKARAKFFTQIQQSFEDQLASGVITAGTPGQVIDKLKVWLEETRPSMLFLYPNDGRLSDQKSLESVRILGTEVLPALREIGDTLGLQSPFEAQTPVSWAAARRGSLSLPAVSEGVP